MNDKDQLPEAPASVNVTYKRTDGFIIQLTLRDKTGIEVLTRLDGAIKKIVEAGGVPHERSFGTKFPPKPVEYVEGRMCPLDKGRLVKGSTKDGRHFIKCENNKYDFATKQVTGCKFTEWPDSPNTSTPTRDINSDKHEEGDVPW